MNASPTVSILVVGTSRDAREAAATLAAESWKITEVDELSKERGAGPYQVVVVDPGESKQLPAHALQGVRDVEPHAAVVMLVTPATPWASWSSYRVRPAGLCLKPLDRTALSAAVDSALVYQSLLEENRQLKHELTHTVSSTDWAGCTPASQRVRESIATSAFAAGPIAFIGEKGCGRRLAAELVHKHAGTPSGRFLRVDLTSLHRGEIGRLLGELRAGAGTTSSNARPGAVYLAELTALSAQDQLTLKEIATQPLPFRLMASAHPSIEAALSQGRFDEEILSRVFKTHVKIPPLRQRRDDIPTLVDHFLKRSCQRFGIQPLGIPASVIEAYANRDWPGNVSELAMVIERAVSIASAAKLDSTMLPERFCTLPSVSAPEGDRLENVSLRELIADIERRIIVETLESVDGSQRRAAKQLGLNPTTLHEKMKRYNLLRNAKTLAPEASIGPDRSRLY